MREYVAESLEATREPTVKVPSAGLNTGVAGGAVPMSTENGCALGHDAVVQTRLYASNVPLNVLSSCVNRAPSVVRSLVVTSHVIRLNGAMLVVARLGCCSEKLNSLYGRVN